MKKRPKKSLGSGSWKATIPDLDDEVTEFSSAMAHLIIGINPYLDISTVHMLLIDWLNAGVTPETAEEIGKYITERARISIADDTPGGMH